MAEYIELIDKYRIIQSEDTDYNPPSYEWVDNTGEIVRCKDCKNNYNTCFNHGINEPMCDFTDRKLREDDFCSYGEKREES